MRRSKPNKKGSQRAFKSRAKKTHPVNLMTGLRGGIRL